MSAVALAPATTRRADPGWWGRAAGLCVLALVAGALTGGLFRWEPSGVQVEVGLLDILGHNLLLAGLMVLLSAYVAWPVVLFNSFFVGLVVHANVVTQGWAETAALTAVHLPLEIAAWLVTLRLAVLVTRIVTVSLRHRRPPVRERLLELGVPALIAFVLYLTAATAEWLELWLHLGRI